MQNIHPTAFIEEGAVIGQNVTIGAFCHIGPEVRVGDGTELKSHVVITGDTNIGENVQIFSFAVVGEIPQDKKFAGEKTKLRIGDNTTIREHVTVNTGTAAGAGLTEIGTSCLLMAGCHIAHDVMLRDRVIIVNNAAIAGHCIIDDDVIIGGLAGVHQFVRIGQGAIIGALTMVTNDVIPYGLVQAPRGQLDGLNLVGLKRRGVPRDDITQLRAAFQMLAQGEGTFQSRATRLTDEFGSQYVSDITDFVLGASDRSFLTPK